MKAGASLFPQSVLDTAISPKDTDKLQAAEALGFHQHIEVYYKGFSCLRCIPASSYHCAEESTIRKHLRKEHIDAFCIRGVDYLPQQPVSTLFTSRIHYYPVDPYILSSSVVNQCALGLYRDQYVEHLRFTQIQRAQEPAQVNHSDLGVWLKHTGWAVRFAGQDMRLLYVLTTKVSSDPLAAHYASRKRVSSNVFQKLQKEAKSKSDTICRLFCAVNSDLTSSKPLHIVEPKTLVEYSNAWHHYVLFLLRAHQIGNIDAGIHKHVLALKNTLESMPLDETIAATKLLRIATATLQQVVLDKWKSLLFIFLSIIAFDPERAKWREAFNY